MSRPLAAAALIALLGGSIALATDERVEPVGTEPGTATRADAGDGPPNADPPAPAVPRRPSRAVGLPHRGRLLHGIQLAAEGEHFVTWDPVRHVTPNRHWRRWGTDRLVQTVMRVVEEHRLANPGAPRVLIGDLSRPRGGEFGPRFGSVGHVSHQNGLDVDVYYPRRDRRETAPRTVRQVDRRLAQDLVDRFVRAGAAKVFVGPRVGLRGRRGVVETLAHHDDHLHFRLSPRG